MTRVDLPNKPPTESLKNHTKERGRVDLFDWRFDDPQQKILTPRNAYSRAIPKSPKKVSVMQRPDKLLSLARGSSAPLLVSKLV